MRESKSGRPHGGNQDEDRLDEPEFAPLTREQAQQLREHLPQVSPWRVIAGQAAVGLAVAALTWVVTQRAQAGWSALYGALTVVIPAAVFARGLGSRLAGLGLGAAVFGFVWWEMVKIAVTVGMLLLAPKIVEGLSWPALLIGLILTMKVYWVALLWRGAAKMRQANRQN